LLSTRWAENRPPSPPCGQTDYRLFSLHKQASFKNPVSVLLSPDVVQPTPRHPMTAGFLQRSTHSARLGGRSDSSAFSTSKDGLQKLSSSRSGTDQLSSPSWLPPPGACGPFFTGEVVHALFSAKKRPWAFPITPPFKLP